MVASIKWRTTVYRFFFFVKKNFRLVQSCSVERSTRPGCCKGSFDLPGLFYLTSFFSPAHTLTNLTIQLYFFIPYCRINERMNSPYFSIGWNFYFVYDVTVSIFFYCYMCLGLVLELVKIFIWKIIYNKIGNNLLWIILYEIYRTWKNRYGNYII